jgi:shikimate dehydrogenase
MSYYAGVMGFPIVHSMSPRLHGYWIKKYKLDAAYEALEVKPEELMARISALKAGTNLPENMQFRGCNLTIPLKETIVAHIDEMEEAAKIIGAVNTVVIGENGQLIGRNTDGIGFSDSLAEHLDLNRFEGGTAMVIGAGGAARAILFALGKMGFSRIILVNRTRTRAEKLAVDLAHIPIEVKDWQEREDVLDEVDLLVNTSSLGMNGQPALEISLAGLKDAAVVTDIVYAPLQTQLLKSAADKGHITVDGLGMLLHQAKFGFEAWFGILPEVDSDLRAYVLEGLGQ